MTGRYSRWGDDEEDDFDDGPDYEEETPTDTIPCPHCGEEVFDEAERCPHCDRFLLDDAVAGNKPNWIVLTALVLVVVTLLPYLIHLLWMR